MATTVYPYRLAEAVIELPGDDPVEIMSITGLPAGQYIITGHVRVSNPDTGSWTSVGCTVREGDHIVGTTGGHLQASRGGGVVDSRSLPLAGHLTVTSGTANLQVECQRVGQVGTPTVHGGSGVTQIIATRVGDAD